MLPCNSTWIDDSRTHSPFVIIPQFLDPSSLAALVKESLNAPVLHTLLVAVLRMLLPFSPDTGLGVLRALTGVPRFDMALLLLTPAQKKDVADAWDTAQAQAAPETPAQLTELRAKYKV